MGLLNVDGYYNYLLTFIDEAVDDGFIKPSQRHIFVSAPNAKELVHKLEVCVVCVFCLIIIIISLMSSLLKWFKYLIMVGGVIILGTR